MRRWENSNDELQRFKREINLADYAASQGYTLDNRESSRHSKIMRHSDGDKIVIATASNGHGVYFSVHNDRDNGSIIDFVHNRRGFSYGEIRKELRPWIGVGPEPARPKISISKPERSTKDRTLMIRDFARTEVVTRHHYIENERHIDSTVLSDARFVGLVRKDIRGNAVFPHFDRNGDVSGFEMKNRKFTGFSPGGDKGLWQSHNLKTAKEIVITESAIDALSHAQLKENGSETAYVSVGGSMSKIQENHIRKVIEVAAQRGARICVATDNDDAGKKLGRQLRDMAPEGTDIRRSVPTKGKDWNKLLKNREQQRELDFDRGRGR